MAADRPKAEFIPELGCSRLAKAFEAPAADANTTGTEPSCTDIFQEGACAKCDDSSNSLVIGHYAGIYAQVSSIFGSILC